MYMYTYMHYFVLRVSVTIVDHEEVGVVGVEGRLHPLLDLDVGVVAHLDAK